MLRDAEASKECEGGHWFNPALGMVHPDLVGLSWKVLSAGRHEKAMVRFPFSRLAALHGAPRSHEL